MLVVDRIILNDSEGEHLKTRYDHIQPETCYLTDLEACEKRIAQYVKAEVVRREEQASMLNSELRQFDPCNLNWSIYAFHVYQLPLGFTLSHPMQSVYRRVYDSNGQFLDESMCAEYLGDNDGDGDNWRELDINRFYGRPKEKIRFKPGDWVEYCDLSQSGQYVGVVSNTGGMEVDWQYKVYQRYDESPYLLISDYSDDSYCVIDDTDGGILISTLATCSLSISR